MRNILFFCTGLLVMVHCKKNNDITSRYQDAQVPAFQKKIQLDLSPIPGAAYSFENQAFPVQIRVKNLSKDTVDANPFVIQAIDINSIDGGLVFNSTTEGPAPSDPQFGPRQDLYLPPGQEFLKTIDLQFWVNRLKKEHDKRPAHGLYSISVGIRIADSVLWTGDLELNVQ